METASLLELPSADWLTEVVLRERDKGVFDNLPWTEKNQNHKYDLELRKRDAFFWAPPVRLTLALFHFFRFRFLFFCPLLSPFF
jgi:hypothetical protein